MQGAVGSYGVSCEMTSSPGPSTLTTQRRKVPMPVVAAQSLRKCQQRTHFGWVLGLNFHPEPSAIVGTRRPWAYRSRRGIGW